MTREQIMAILPHRDDMLLLDSAELDGEIARATYRVRGNEFFLRGHFPQNPVVPGVILCEILAQSACVLLSGVLASGGTPMYTGIDKARFRAPARPGDVLTTQCRLVKAKHPFYFCEGSLQAGGKLCLKAEFSFAIVEGNVEGK